MILKKLTMLNEKINLEASLTFKAAFKFPLQSAIARKEILIGGVLLLVPFIGWLLNMGHRIQILHHMMNGKPAWPAWANYTQLLKNGFTTFLGMVYYYLPAICLGFAYARYHYFVVAVIALLAFILATIAIPGYMSHYCKNFDAREIFYPAKALSRIYECGTSYWHAWGIALAALALSTAGFLFFGFGFLFTSVWFWQVAGFSFASIITKQHSLMQKKYNE
jgi:hypothetical protein